LQQTRRHTERLNAIFGFLGEKPQATPCKGMMGLIAAAQKVEHYEISGYGTARCLARQIGVA
jgi:Mn-containing catalase